MASATKSTETQQNSSGWRSTACILCSINCGIEVQLEGRHLKRIH